METKLPTSVECSDLSDEDLFAAYRLRRDQDAVSELIRRYERPLYNYLVRYTGDPSRAEELFQTTFQRVIERCNQFTPGRKFRPWLYSIATHLAIDVRRHTGRQRSLESSSDSQESDSHSGTPFDLLTNREPGPPAQVEAEERRRIVRAAVETLPDDLRRIVILAYYQGLTLREVAEALDLPLGTVKSRLHKALLALHNTCFRSQNPDAL